MGHVKSDGEVQAVHQTMLDDHDREEEFHERFFDAQAGVKSLVDSGMKKVPLIFHQRFKRDEDKPGFGQRSPILPSIIDINAAMHSDTVEKIRDASENWGFFQVVNHGIPASVMENMINAVRGFHEQDLEKKKKFFSLDTRSLFKFNGLPFDRTRFREPCFGDCISSAIQPLAPNFGRVPEEFRSPIMEYLSHAKALGMTLFELLSEALGLKSSHLKDFGCAYEQFFVGHYYPPCPEPDVALYAKPHTDIAFLNILIQDQIGGLQVLHRDEWIDVSPSLEL